MKAGHLDVQWLTYTLMHWNLSFFEISSVVILSCTSFSQINIRFCIDWRMCFVYCRMWTHILVPYYPIPCKCWGSIVTGDSCCCLYFQCSVDTLVQLLPSQELCTINMSWYLLLVAWSLPVLCFLTAFLLQQRALLYVALLVWQSVYTFVY